MNRVYLLPKIFILTFIIMMFYEPINIFSIALIFLINSIVVLVIHVIILALTAKYYLYLECIDKPVSKEKIYDFVHRHMALANRFMLTHVAVTHYERFNPNHNYLITPNHQSNADATIMMEAFKSPYLFVSKFSMSKVIIVKDWMNLMGCMFLKKDDMRGQIAVMNEVENKLKEHHSVIIFPEGQRSFSYEMNEFKPGTFKMATKTKVDILPVTINHAHKIRHRFPFRSTQVDVYIHEPISYETYKDMSTQEIAKMVQSIVESKIEK